ncbi:abortive infection family protein [Pseudomonas kribbensis]|uniref:Abortive infection protein-like C-terminal domain-containing protein n=1 Tax=Pseudomonas kribbensis TaxID=1628086 RepID=A0A4Y8VDS7_9PSED|nr:abortive infection family protein [Pseudomonas kribbensis]TFH79128.1 hypothetical protein E4J90_17780 [Pseudomonas kribbensis]
MASDNGLAGLAALSAKVRSERRILVERLKAFEKKLLEAAEGIGCYAYSKSVTLSTWDHEESGFSGGKAGWLAFDGEKLTVRTESYSDSGQESKYDEQDLDRVPPGWLIQLSAPRILDSLVVNISKTLEEEHTLFATANEWLTKFVAVEKALIDGDLEENFEQHPNLLESWQKARKTVESDPEDSITRSCSHLETVLKACLKQLGDTGYETLSVDKLNSRVMRKLRDAGIVDGGALQALTGLGTIFHGIATIRNSSSTAHGRIGGYFPPGIDVAQFINHLAGCGSAFVLRQTAKILEGKG